MLTITMKKNYGVHVLSDCFSMCTVNASMIGTVTPQDPALCYLYCRVNY